MTNKINKEYVNIVSELLDETLSEFENAVEEIMNRRGINDANKKRKIKQFMRILFAYSLLLKASDIILELPNQEEENINIIVENLKG